MERVRWVGTSLFTPIDIPTTQTCLNTEGSFICNLAEDVEVRLTNS